MYSGRLPRSTAWAAVSGVTLVAFLGLAGCTGETSSRPDSPAMSSAQTPSVAHDGRTILASPGTTSCQVISPDLIRQHLGTRAADLQAEQSSGVQDSEGVKKESCIYPFDERGLTTNAVVVEVTTYPTAAALAAADPFQLMTAPEDVGGLGDQAKLAVNSLSETNEFVLTVVNGIRVTRLLIAVPASAANWDKSTGRDLLKSLARDAKF
jgi:hypothetical protein